jgi:hypothetical protein
MKSQLDRTAKLSFYKVRRRKGDLQRLANSTFYSIPHISNVVAGRRNVSNTLADAMYSISRRRTASAKLLAA